MMKLSSYSGNPYIGVYCVANDKIALVPSDADEQMVSEFREALGVEVVRITVSSSHILGSLVAMNSEGAVVTGQIEASELEKLERHIPVIRIEDKLNAAGNNILINDKGAVVNRNLRPHTVKALENFFGFECIRLRVAGMDTVGSVCKVTNKGGICHPKATPEEMAELSGALGVEFSPITLNYGSAMVGACVVANSKGALVGNISTTIELGHLEEALGLY